MEDEFTSACPLCGLVWEFVTLPVALSVSLYSCLLRLRMVGEDPQTCCLLSALPGRQAGSALNVLVTCALPAASGGCCALGGRRSALLVLVLPSFSL